MKKILNKYAVWIVWLCFIALAVYAANPSFSSFNGNQFDTSANVVTVKPSATTTNPAIWNTALNPFTVHGGQGFKFLYSDDVTPIAFLGGSGWFFTGAGTFTNGLTNRSWTASTVLKTDGGLGAVSIANSAGALTNDGAGNIGWLAGIGGGGFDPTASNYVLNAFAFTDAQAITNQWYGPTNSINVVTNDYFFIASSDVSVNGIIFSPGFRNDTVLTVSNSVATNITARILATIRTTDGLRAYTISNGQMGEIHFWRKNGGTNASFNMLW